VGERATEKEAFVRSTLGDDRKVGRAGGRSQLVDDDGWRVVVCVGVWCVHQHSLGQSLPTRLLMCFPELYYGRAVVCTGASWAVAR